MWTQILNSTSAQLRYTIAYSAIQVDARWYTEVGIK